LKPEEIVVALRIAQVEDNVMPKMQAALQDAVAKAARLRASGIGEKHPRLLAVEQQIEVFEETMTNAMTSLKQNQAALLEVERRTLAKLEGEFEKASKAQIEDKVHVVAYMNAKAQYLKHKKVYEAAEIKYDIEDLERASNPNLH
jgi:hypothetical protein